MIKFTTTAKTTDNFNKKYQELASKFEYFSPLAFKLCSLTGISLEINDPKIEEKLESLVRSLLIRTLKLGTCNQARKEIIGIDNDLCTSFSEHCVSYFESTVRFKYAVYKILTNNIALEEDQRKVFEEAELSTNDYLLFEYLTKDIDLLDKALSNLPKIKGTLVTPSELYYRCCEYLEANKIYIKKYVIAKLRFIASSNNYDINDLSQDLEGRAARSYYKNWLFIEDSHLESMAKTSVKNVGKNMIKKFTTASKGRLIQLEDGTYTNIQQSLNAGDSFTNSDLNQQIEFDVLDNNSGDHSIDNKVSYYQVADYLIKTLPNPIEKMIVKLQYQIKDPLLEKSFLEYIKKDKYLKDQGKINKLSNYKTVGQVFEVGYNCNNTKFMNLICDYLNDVHRPTKKVKRSHIKDINNRFYLEFEGVPYVKRKKKK